MIWPLISLHVLGSTYMLTRVSTKVIHLRKQGLRTGRPGADGCSSGLSSSKGYELLKGLNASCLTLSGVVLVLPAIKAGLQMHFHSFCNSRNKVVEIIQHFILFYFFSHLTFSLTGEDGWGFPHKSDEQNELIKNGSVSAWANMCLRTLEVIFPRRANI